MPDQDLPENLPSPDRPGPEWQTNAFVVVERPFQSAVPVVGPLIAALRSAWNSVSTKWYVRGILQQQNEVNRQIAERLAFVQSRLDRVQSQLDQMQSQLIHQDRGQSALIHDVAEVSAQLTLMNRLLHANDERLARLEAQQSDG